MADSSAIVVIGLGLFVLVLVAPKNRPETHDILVIILLRRYNLICETLRGNNKSNINKVCFNNINKFLENESY